MNQTATASGQPAYGRVLLMVALGAWVLSFDSLLVRMAQAEPWSVVFWRGLFIGLSLGTISLFRGHANQLTRRSMAPWYGAALSAANSALFVMAVTYTQVANAVVILSAAPLCAALCTWFLLREHVPLRTWAAIVLAMLGILIVFAGSLSSGGLLGDGFALAAALTVGGYLTLLRRHPTLDRVTVIAAGGFISALVAWPMATPLGLSWESYAVLALMGLVQMPLALVLMANGTRHLPSAEVALFLLIETVLGTLWVWWLLGEEPPELTFLGGGLILVTLAVHAVLGMRARSRQVSAD